jgi:hypothetical protein
LAGGVFGELGPVGVPGARKGPGTRLTFVCKIAISQGAKPSQRLAFGFPASTTTPESWGVPPSTSGVPLSVTVPPSWGLASAVASSTAPPSLPAPSTVPSKEPHAVTKSPSETTNGRRRFIPPTMTAPAGRCNGDIAGGPCLQTSTSGRFPLLDRSVGADRQTLFRRKAPPSCPPCRLVHRMPTCVIPEGGTVSPLTFGAKKGFRAPIRGSVSPTLHPSSVRASAPKRGAGLQRSAGHRPPNERGSHPLKDANHLILGVR